MTPECIRKLTIQDRAAPPSCSPQHSWGACSVLSEPRAAVFQARRHRAAQSLALTAAQMTRMRYCCSEGGTEGGGK
ncbi:hypothetical protein E2C01_042151 [Portunus trituberculatus]|uniref:Uncharacterized protein n=1 Tax=Portunus trituberculatus TaxID=210409 RepID=A0A5B7FL07_PORTR|nr:hypothetical protein [Portunus trituberculatus]